VVDDPSGDVLWSRAEGVTARFHLHGQDGESAEVPGTLSDTGLGYAYDDSFGNVLVFGPVVVDSGASDPKFMLTSRTDMNGNTTTFLYDDDNGDGVHDELIAIEDPFGRQSVFGYAPIIVGGPIRLSSITDYVGRATSFTYDTDGQSGSYGFLTSVIEPPVFDESSGGQANPTTSYTYTAAGRIETITDPRGFVSENIYDGNDLLIAVVDFDGTVYQEDSAIGATLAPAIVLTSDVGKTKVTRRGYTETRELNEWGNEVVFTDPLGNQFITDRDGSGLVKGGTETVSVAGIETAVATKYNQSGNNPFLIRSIEYPGVTSPKIEFTFNDVNLPATTTDELGREVRMVYAEDAQRRASDDLSV